MATDSAAAHCAVLYLCVLLFVVSVVI